LGIARPRERPRATSRGFVRRGQALHGLVRVGSGRRSSFMWIRPSDGCNRNPRASRTAAASRGRPGPLASGAQDHKGFRVVLRVDGRARGCPGLVLRLVLGLGSHATPLLGF
jgi:hypothetical protein